MKKDCHVAFLSDNECFHIKCYSNERCIPILKVGSIGRISMVLVKPTDDDTWEEVLATKGKIICLIHQCCIYKLNFLEYSQFDRENVLNSLLMGEESDVYDTLACEVGDSTCNVRTEICVQNRPKSRAGTCQCKDGYFRNRNGNCQPTRLLMADRGFDLDDLEITTLSTG